MSGDPVSITINNTDWEQKINRLRALESVERQQRQVEFICLGRVYTAAKGGDLDEFINALREYSDEGTASFYDIISTKGLCGNSLFHFTAGIENADILRALLEVIDDKQLATQANDRGDTALHFAARASKIDAAELLLNSCNAVDQPNDVRDWPLHEAVKNGDKEFTELLLSRGSKSVNKKNEEGKCPLYLAVETGNLEILSLLLKAVDGNEVLSSWIEGMSPVHGAIMHRRIDMLMEMSKMKGLFDLKNAIEDTPLHLAARENYVDGVKFLVKEFTSSAFKHNKEAYFPIHVACQMGHLETIKVLRQHWQDWFELGELLTFKRGQNILHVAAKYGRASVVKYILGDPKLEKLINMKDNKGNTPLHIATEKWQPGVLLSLTRDTRVNLGLVNHKNSTALDIVDNRLRKIDGPLHQSLTRTILVSAKAPRSKDKAILQTSLRTKIKPPNLDTLKRRAEVRMVVATLIASVTFAAGFSIPGGYNNSEPNVGIIALLNKPLYDVFVICNSIAMYNSIIAVVILLWTQVNDSHAVFRALEMTRQPLLIALATMSVTFMAGVYIVISKRPWIAIVTLVVGITALFIILILYIVLFIPLGYNYRLLQFFADYIIRAAILISSTESVPGETSTAIMPAPPPVPKPKPARLQCYSLPPPDPPYPYPPYPYPPYPPYPYPPAPPSAPYPSYYPPPGPSAQPGRPPPPSEPSAPDELERPYRPPPPRKPFPPGPPPRLGPPSPPPLPPRRNSI